MELMDSIFLPTLCSIHLHLCASVATKGRESLDSGGLRLTFQVPKMEESSPIKKTVDTAYVREGFPPLKLAL